MKKKVVLSLALLLMLLAMPITSAEAIILMPDVDATIFDFGNDGSVDFINHTGTPQALNNSTFASRALFEFDISALTGPITDVNLDLNVTSALGPYPLSLGFYSYTGDGSITNPDYFLGSLLGTFNYTGQTNVLFDVTSALQSSVTANDDFFGVNIRLKDQNDVPNSPPYVAFNSLENPREALLKINETGSGTTVPEPASMLLFGIGLVGAFVQRFKKVK